MPFNRSLKHWRWLLERRLWYARMYRQLLKEDWQLYQEYKYRVPTVVSALPNPRVGYETIKEKGKDGVERTRTYAYPHRSMHDIGDRIRNNRLQERVGQFEQGLGIIRDFPHWEYAKALCTYRRSVTNWLGLPVIDESLLTILDRTHPSFDREELLQLAARMPPFSKIRRVLLERAREACIHAEKRSPLWQQLVTNGSVSD